MHFVLVFAEAISIGVASYALGIVPLVVKSQSCLSALTVLGNGWLLGAAWSIIFLKMIMGAASTLLPQQFGLSRTVVALSDMGGILFMWMANRGISARALNADRHPQRQSEVDAEQLSSLVLSSQQEGDDTKSEEREKNPDTIAQPAAVPQPLTTPCSRMTPAVGPRQQRIYLFTLSLIIQLLIKGISNGHRATGIRRTPKLIGNPAPASSLEHFSHYVHSLFDNASMTFALSGILRSASFPIARCEQHLVAAAAAMPLAEMISYTVITVIGISSAQYEVFPLLALRSFTDGMFIYAVLILRCSLGGSDAKSGRRLWTTCLWLVGMFMVPAGPSLMLIPISAFWKMMQRHSG